MIAPLQPPEAPQSSPTLRHARSFVASALLRGEAGRSDNAPPVRPWLAWLFTAWVVSVVSAWLASMAGWF